MIKLTLNSDSHGNEYKAPKTVYAWIGFQHGDLGTFQVACTFHKSMEDANALQMVQTDKLLQVQCVLSGQYVVDMTGNTTAYTVEGLKTYLQEQTILKMKEEHESANLTHVTKFEIV